MPSRRASSRRRQPQSQVNGRTQLRGHCTNRLPFHSLWRGSVHNRPAGGPLWKLDKDLKLRADLAQNDTISPCRVLDQVASMGFQLFACPECEYQNVYVFVRRDGGL